MNAPDEQRLILRIKEGDHGAFRILVERYMKHAYNIAYGFVNNHTDAEDIVQESFIRAYEAINGFRGDSNFNTWLYRIITNLSLNRLRQKKTARFQSIDVLNEVMLPCAVMPEDGSRSDVQQNLERALHELPTLQRAVIILRHINGLSTKQVSTILRCSDSTVKTHLHRGLKRMREKVNFLKDEVI